MVTSQKIQINECDITPSTFKSTCQRVTGHSGKTGHCREKKTLTFSWSCDDTSDVGPC